MTDLNDIIEFLKEIKEDEAPKNVKEKIIKIIKVLESDNELSIKKDKAIQILDELNSTPTLDSYIRTQFYNVLSSLESL